MNNDILTAFKASDLVDKNINFLIGSGASAGYIPTLWVKDDVTYEDILTNKKNIKKSKTLFIILTTMIYYLKAFV